MIIIVCIDFHFVHFTVTEFMMKCEDALMSSDLFANDALFMPDFADEPLTIDGENPFDFLNSAENLPPFPADNFNAQNQASDFLENPQSLYYVNAKDDNTNIPKINAQINNLVYDNVSPGEENAKELPTPSNSSMPKLLAPAVQNKDVEVKLTTSQQIRNIQPKPETSSYRIVPVKAVNAVNSNAQSSQSQAIKIHTPHAIASNEKISQSPKETVVKKVVPFSDLTLVNTSNSAKKQVR